METKLLKAQTFVLLGGTLFSWFTIFTDFKRFYEMYGSITKITDCAIPNPVTTPCFYGAIAFLMAFIMSFRIYKKHIKGESAIKDQLKLWYLLIFGTIFAWSNFGYEVFKFYSVETEIKVSCSGVPTDNVFLTPCFYGSVIFLMGLVGASVIKRKLQKQLF